MIMILDIMILLIPGISVFCEKEKSTYLLPALLTILTIIFKSFQQHGCQTYHAYSHILLLYSYS